MVVRHDGTNLLVDPSSQNPVRCRRIKRHDKQLSGRGCVKEPLRNRTRWCYECFFRIAQPLEDPTELALDFVS